jgi:hypothetical protein
MTLTDFQVNDLNYFLRSTAPVISRPEERESRRLEGSIEMGSSDARGYTGIMVYLQKGLGNSDKLLQQIFRCAERFQKRFRLKYDLGLFSFGWDEKKIKHSGSIHNCTYYSDIISLIGELYGLAGTDESPSPVIIPELFPLADPYGRRSDIDRNDLLIFICQNRDIRVTESVYDQLHKRNFRHVIWFFVENSTVEIETSRYYPEKI